MPSDMEQRYRLMATLMDSLIETMVLMLIAKHFSKNEILQILQGWSKSVRESGIDTVANELLEETTEACVKRILDYLQTREEKEADHGGTEESHGPRTDGDNERNGESKA